MSQRPLFEPHSSGLSFPKLLQQELSILRKVLKAVI